MGIFDKALGLMNWSKTSGFRSGVETSSVFSTSERTLAPVVAKDLGYSGLGLPATIHEALSVPAIYRAIALYSTAAGAVTIPATSPAWIRENYGSITPEARLVSIVQDLIFHRESCLMIERDGSGAITSALRLPYEMWALDYAGNVTIGGQPLADQSRVIYISSLMPLGLLEAASDTIEHYIDLRNTIRSRSRNPIPLVELHITDEFEGTSVELEQARTDWSTARRSEDGAVAFTPKGIELKIHTGTGNDSDMLTAARNAVRLDVANFLNINASMLEGANGTSDTYSNTLQSKDEFLSLSLDLWLSPILARLNSDDVDPSGSVVFDTSALGSTGDAQGNTGTAVDPSIKQGEIAS